MYLYKFLIIFYKILACITKELCSQLTTQPKGGSATVGNGKWIRIPEINVDWKASMAMVENTIMDKGFYQQ
jgi:hypothetical protein